MDVWDDSQKDGPETPEWKRLQPKPHEYFEPHKNDLLKAVSARRQWRFLLDDPSTSNEEWWARLMRFLRLHEGW